MTTCGHSRFNPKLGEKGSNGYLFGLWVQTMCAFSILYVRPAELLMLCYVLIECLQVALDPMQDSGLFIPYNYVLAQPGGKFQFSN